MLLAHEPRPLSAASRFKFTKLNLLYFGPDFITYILYAEPSIFRPSEKGFFKKTCNPFKMC